MGLFALGMIGVLSLPLSLVPLLEHELAQAGTAIPSRNVLVVMTLIQPTLLLALGIAIGCTLAPRLELVSLLDRTRPLNRLRRCAPMAIAWGLTLAALFTVADVFFFRVHLDESTVSILEQGGIASTLAAMLYGGITEEIITRWGLMSLFAWLGWRIFQRNRDRPPDSVFYAAIVLAAICFAVAHLPAAMKMGTLSIPLVARVLTLNTAAGLVFGWLFWRHNLETAMLAHASVHVGLAAAVLVGWS